MRFVEADALYIMATVNDVLHHIAQDFHSFSWGYDGNRAQAFAAPKFQISIAITTDVEESELSFVERLGPGRTFYFKLKDYDQGKQLAAELYKVFNGERPDMQGHKGGKFPSDHQLYLFIHLRFLPVAVAC